MSSETLLLVFFIALILSVLMIDLLFVGRKSHIVSTKEALGWTVVWVSLALGFYAFLLFHGHRLHGIENLDKLHEVVRKYSPELIFRTHEYESMLREYRNHMALNYLSGYFIEETLSVDNIFVILLILQGFAVPLKNYKTVLFWGILGAIFLRFVFIFAGAALIQQFEWVLYVFGVFLLYQGAKILFKKEDNKKDPHDYAIFRFLSKHFSIYKEYVDNQFFVRINHKFFITPLFVVLVLIEFTDVIFALDSIPAIFSVSRDPYIVFFSNIFAIIGLRSLFFLIANMVNKFRFLSVGVSVLLMFVGFKLLFHHWLEHIGFKASYSLYFIGITLLLSVVFSVLFPLKEKPQPVVVKDVNTKKIK
jgi:tellurite resistance protein TerC